MIVLVGETRSHNMMLKLRALGWGRLWTVGTPAGLWEGEPWGFDSGIYAAWNSGRFFDEEAFRKRVDRAHAVGRPYMAVAPDIVGGGLESLEYSITWLRRLPSDYPWFLAVQDGQTPDDVEPVINKFSGIFLGGTNRYKTTAPVWASFAHAHGVPFHFGRAGTPQKLATAQECADSCDSSFPLWTNERFGYFREMWINNPQKRLPWGD